MIITHNVHNKQKNNQVEENKSGENKTISNVLIGEGKTEPKKRSRKLLFFILVVILRKGRDYFLNYG